VDNNSNSVISNPSKFHREAYDKPIRDFAVHHRRVDHTGSNLLDASGDKGSSDRFVELVKEAHSRNVHSLGFDYHNSYKPILDVELHNRIDCYNRSMDWVRIEDMELMRMTRKDLVSFLYTILRSQLVHRVM